MRGCSARMVHAPGSLPARDASREAIAPRQLRQSPVQSFFDALQSVLDPA